MSYTPFVFFGYEIQLPSDNRSRTINMLYDLNVMIKEPFEITCILPTFYPALDEEEYARVVIGFVPDQIDELIDLANDLKSFIDDSVLLEGLEIVADPLFHCGVEWYPEIGSDSGSETETESESESESGSESESESGIRLRSRYLKSSSDQNII